MTLLFEIWKDCVSVPEYQVSSFGRVMRKPYQAIMPNGGLRWYGGIPHYGQWTKDDPRPNFFFRGKTYRISILVCETFNGPKPFPNAVVMHDDDDSTNNEYENLKWGTQKENLNAPSFIEYCEHRIEIRQILSAWLGKPHNDSPLSGSLGPDAGLPATIGPEPATGTSNRSPAEPPAVSGAAGRPPDRAGKA